MKIFKQHHDVITHAVVEHYPTTLTTVPYANDLNETTSSTCPQKYNTTKYFNEHLKLKSTNFKTK